MGKKVYFKVDERIAGLPDEVLTPAQKLFFSKLDFRCNHKRICWWSNKRLAEDEGRCVRSVQYWNRKLESLGLIEIQYSEKGGVNVIHVPELDDDHLWGLGSRWNRRLDDDEEDCTGGMQPVAREGAVDCTPIVKGNSKMKKKTDGKESPDPVRAELNAIFDDDDVKASGKRAVEAAENQKGHTVLSPDNPDAPTKQEDALPDNARLSKWKSTAWTTRFVATMKARGYEVAFAEYKAADNHIKAIRNHLLNLGFSHRKIYRFLLMWLPDAYPSICEAEFKKDPDDFMFSIAWMEPRLSRLVTLYNEGTSKPKRSSKKRTAHYEED